MNGISPLPGRLQEVLERIGGAAARSGRGPEAVTLLAVTKTFPVQRIQEAYDLGLRDFGENRVQEALEKIPSLPSDVRWHLIGRLQSNKINKVLGKFTLVQSLDSTGLGIALSSKVGPEGQDVLLEVNVSGEGTKAGVAPHEVEKAVEVIGSLQGLRLRGLMTVGPLTTDPGRQRDAFKRLKGHFEAIRRSGKAGKGFSVLSMGMSSDYIPAVEEGSTLVRIGSALFGERV